MTQSASDNEDDLVTLMFMVCGGVTSGLFSIGVILIPVRVWMVQHALLASGSQVVIPFVDGIGLGWAQITVIVGLLVLLIALTTWTRRRRSRDRV